MPIGPSSLIRRVARTALLYPRWIWEAHEIGACVLGLAAALGYILWGGPVTEGEPRVRYAGLVLQLLGILTVAMGVSQTRTLFRRPGMRAAAAQWFSRHPKLIPRPIAGSLNTTLEGLTANVHLRGSAAARLSSSLEDRINELGTELKRIEQLVTDASAQLRQADAQLREGLDSEVMARTAEVSRVSAILESAQTGGLNLTMAGAIWLFFGAILGSLSVELAIALNR